ncbi:MAG: hypothetical protein K9J85_05335 [Desulfobacteraceae bacterium]|nr:hypothetical protein [Desulfobacteraceae bacterium]
MADQNLFPALLIPLFVKQANLWAEQFPAILSIHLFRMSGQTTFLYLLFFEFEPSAKESPSITVEIQDLLNWSDESCMHVESDIPALYKHQADFKREEWACYCGTNNELAYWQDCSLAWVCLFDAREAPIKNNSKSAFKGNVDEKGFLPISSDQGLRWNDITISFLSDTELHIQYKEDMKPRNITRSFDKIGFGDGRKGGHVPVKSWWVFLQAAKEEKIPHSFENRRLVESIIKDLRSKLRAMFPGVSEDPIPHNRADNSYHFAFHLKPPSE